MVCVWCMCGSIRGIFWESSFLAQSALSSGLGICSRVSGCYVSTSIEDGRVVHDCLPSLFGIVKHAQCVQLAVGAGDVYLAWGVGLVVGAVGACVVCLGGDGFESCAVMFVVSCDGWVCAGVADRVRGVEHCSGVSAKKV